MRKKIALVLFAAFALGSVGAGLSPAEAKPVEVRRECGTINVYVNGTPLIHHVWCPEHPPA